MYLYHLLDRLFPKSFAARIFFVAFIGTHIPLIAAVIFAVQWNGGITQNGPALLILLGATLVGSLATLGAIWALLAPIRRSRAAFQTMEDGGQPVFAGGVRR